MDTQIQIKEEDPFSCDIDSQNEQEVCTKNVAIKTNSNVVLLNNDWDMTIKMEIKSESPVTDFYLKKIEFDEQTLVPEFVSQTESEFLQERPITKFNKFNSDDDMDNKVEIKQEYWWLESETSYVCDDIKDEKFLAVKSPRSYMEAVSGDSAKSLLYSAEDSSKDVCLYTDKDSASNGHSRNSKGHGSYVSKDHSEERNIHCEQSSKYYDGEKAYSNASYLKPRNATHEVSRSHKCEICEKRFTALSNLKRHNLIHEGQKPYKCAICEKRFTALSNLKRHNLIHEGEKTHKCAICEKRFTQLSHLKRHNLIHEGLRPHKCEICEKTFTALSNLKRHNLIHEGKSHTSVQFVR